MNKKLLATSALISTLALSSVSFAQTTITGSLDLTFRSHGFDANAGANSETTFGRESQINIANKGKLNNGLDYAAGFSWELDGDEALGGDSTAGAVSNDSTNARQENAFIDLIVNKDITLSISADHMPNTDVTMTNLVFGFKRETSALIFV